MVIEATEVIEAVEVNEAVEVLDGMVITQKAAFDFLRPKRLLRSVRPVILSCLLRSWRPLRLSIPLNPWNY